MELARITRLQFLSMIPRDKSSLEIGALDKPLLHPTQFNNKILDVFDAETLKRNVNDPNINRNAIVDVDYVWSGQPYTDLISDRFDFVISSHNIEHQPDLIAYLSNVASVLKPGGAMYLIIPDYRFCFDAFRQPSTILEVLGAHIDKKQKPSATDVLDLRAKQTHNFAYRHWAGDHGNMDTSLNDPVSLCKIYDEVAQKVRAGYVDTHVWKFAPASFVNIMGLLRKMGLTDLDVELCSDTLPNSLEFYARLIKA